MEDQAESDLNYHIWILIADLHHKMLQVRQNEVSKYNISTRQLYNLRIIDSLGPKAKLSELAKIAQRKIDVISRQSAFMEKDGLIRRIKETPKSRLLRLEVTDKGRENVYQTKIIQFITVIICKRIFFRQKSITN